MALGRLTLLEAFERPGPALFEDPALWDAALMSELASRAARADLMRGERRQSWTGFYGLHAAREMRAEGLL